ncbi:MAG: site-specific DNA-methyltransferase [bacterium]|nr:site-specific DNA-methyltransferase [bacterium]
MEKLKMQTPDITNRNIEQIASLFPNVITETKDEKGNIKKAIDFDLLKQNLSNVLVEADDERYRLDWPGKKASLLKANTPITKTLRPVREDSVDFDNTENVYIEGDNFEVLKILQESYLGKIKMIYIDPPYNTGTAMIYNNDFSINEQLYAKELGAVTEDGIKMFRNTNTDGRIHSNWLSFMYERLVVARDLLTDDGIICLTIDDYEISRIWMVLDEIFGEDNHLGTIAIRNNPAGRSTAKGVSITHEYALFYGKSDNSIVGRLPRNKNQIDRYSEKDEKGHFEWVNFRKPGSKKEESPKMHYPIFVSEENIRLPDMFWDSKKSEWVLNEQPAKNVNIVFPIDDEGKNRRWRWAVKRFKNEIAEIKSKYLKDKWHVYLKSRIPNNGVLPNTWWDKKEYPSTAYGTNLMKTVFGELQIFSYPKSIYAILDSLRMMAESKDSLILDFFSGSATTAHAVMQLNAEDGGNRKFIMVQLPEKTDEESEAYKAGYKTIAEIGKERIRRAGKKIKEELEEKNMQLKLGEEATDINNLDIGFRVYKTDSSNMKDIYFRPTKLEQQSLFNTVSNIKEDRTPEDLLTQVILDLGLELNLPIETKIIHGNTVFIVQTNALVACFDDSINFKIVDEIAELKPFKVVFKDASFHDDKDRINVEERFKRLSPETVITVL